MIKTREDALRLFRYENGSLHWNVDRPNQVKSGVEITSTSSGYRQVEYLGKKYKVHRLIFLMAHGYLPKTIDHINGDTLDNRIENLRDCTTTQNVRNARTRSDNTSGVKGVGWHKSSGKWVAYIRVNKKHIHLGLFESFHDAVKVRKEAAEKYHKEFANHG